MKPQRPALVFDVGSNSVRCGYASQTAEVPKIAVPSIVAYPNQKQQQTGGDNDGAITVYCGIDAVKMRAVSQISHPLRDGQISSSTDVRQLLGHVTDLLRGTQGLANEIPVVVCEPLFASKSYRQEVANCFFEELGAPSIMFASQGLCSLFAVGELSGIVLDVGESSTRAIAAVDGIGIPSTFSTTRIGGDAVTEQLAGLLRDGNQAAAVDFAAQIKEAQCRCAEDAEAVRALFTPAVVPVGNAAAAAASGGRGGATRDFQLPDKSIVRITPVQRTVVSEVLFNDNVSPQPMSLPQVVDECVLACDEVLRPHMMSRVHTCGATAQMNGFEKRLLSELHRDKSHVVKDIDVATRSLYAIPAASSSFDDGSTRRNSAAFSHADRTWTGAAIFSSLSSVAPAMFTTREEYAESGVSALGRHRQLAA